MLEKTMKKIKEILFWICFVISFLSLGPLGIAMLLGIITLVLDIELMPALIVITSLIMSVIIYIGVAKIFIRFYH